MVELAPWSDDGVTVQMYLSPFRKGLKQLLESLCPTGPAELFAFYPSHRRERVNFMGMQPLQAPALIRLNAWGDRYIQRKTTGYSGASC